MARSLNLDPLRFESVNDDVIIGEGQEYKEIMDTLKLRRIRIIRSRFRAGARPERSDWTWAVCQCE